ncbi:MAG: AAA family ATPase [Planctomycetes bacterium]|nr:AAA family ATPase [Planctomycetota bacterium]
MVAVNTSVADQSLLRYYDDGAGWPNETREKERAFRRGFLEEARRVAREWADPDDAFDPFVEEQAAHNLRLRVHERYSVYQRGVAGRKTYHLGYRPGHEVPAARLRGRHHALAYVAQSWDEVSDFDAFDHLILPAWLVAVEHWAIKPIRPRIISPPPRPLEIVGAEVVLRPDPSKQVVKLTTCPPAPAVQGLALRVDAVCLADVEPEPVRWLWPGRFALGKLSLIAGEPGLGKSFLTLDMAARVSRGDGWPCNEAAKAEPGGVVLLSAEDDIKDTIVPRLIAAGADRLRILAMRALYQPVLGLGGSVEKPVPFSLLEHIPQLEEMIRRAAPCRLVIVDPVSAFLGGTDSHNNSEVRGVLAPLAEMAARNRVAVVAVTHLNKGQGSALNRVIGSIAFTAAARAAYVVTKDEDAPARRLMLPAKNNLGCDEDGFAYHLEGEPTPHVEWEPVPVAMSADEAVGLEPRRGPQPDARHDAEAWLLDFLAAGPRLAKEVYENAAGDGHTKDTIRRAKATLNVKASKDGYQGAWTWTLPGAGPLMVGAASASLKGAANSTEGGLP